MLLLFVLMFALFQGFIRADSTAVQSKSPAVIDRAYLTGLIKNSGKADFSLDAWRKGNIQALARELGYSYTASFDASKPGRVQASFFKKEAAIKRQIDADEPTAIAGEPVSKPSAGREPVSKPSAVREPISKSSAGPLDLSQKISSSAVPDLRNIKIELAKNADFVSGRDFILRNKPIIKKQLQFPPQTLPLAKSQMPTTMAAELAWDSYVRKNWGQAAEYFAQVQARSPSRDGDLEESAAIAKWNAAMLSIAKYKPPNSIKVGFSLYTDLMSNYRLLLQAEDYYRKSANVGISRAGSAAISRRYYALAKLYDEMKWIIGFITPKQNNTDCYETELGAASAAVSSHPLTATHDLRTGKSAPSPHEYALKNFKALGAEMEARSNKLNSDIEKNKAHAMQSYAQALTK